MIALLKDAPLPPRKETSKEAHVIKHQRAIDRVIRALNSLNADSSIKEVLESTVWTVRQAGIPSNNPGNSFDKASIARGIGAISILYNILLTNPKTDRETIFRQHPEIRQCLTDFNARSSTLSNFPAPAVEKLFKVLSFETRLALIQASKLTWKWPNPAQKLTFTLTRAYKIRPTLEEVRKLKKKFPNINSVTFKHLRLDEGKDSKTIERILLIMSLWDIRHFCITDSSFYDFSVYSIFNNISRNLESLMIKRNTWKGYSMDIPGSFVFDFSRNLKVLEFRENHWKDGKISDFLATCLPNTLEKLVLLGESTLGESGIKSLESRLPHTQIIHR